jgi:hypothetical protein
MPVAPTLLSTWSPHALATPPSTLPASAAETFAEATGSKA